MKSRIIRGQTKNQYPMLMESKDTENLVVLMTAPHIGTVVSTESIYNIGEYHTSWAIDSFYPLEGSIIIEP